MTVYEMQSAILSSMMKEAFYRNYDIDALVKFLLTSPYGKSIVTGDLSSEYAADTYMLAGLVKEGDIGETKEKKYSDFECWFAGYLYRYWCGKYGDSPELIYKCASIDKIHESFGFLHTQGWDYVISFLKESYDNTEGE